MCVRVCVRVSVCVRVRASVCACVWIHNIDIYYTLHGIQFCEIGTVASLGTSDC